MTNMNWIEIRMIRPIHPSMLCRKHLSQEHRKQNKKATPFRMFTVFFEINNKYFRDKMHFYYRILLKEKRIDWWRVRVETKNDEFLTKVNRWFNCRNILNGVISVNGAYYINCIIVWNYYFVKSVTIRTSYGKYTSTATFADFGMINAGLGAREARFFCDITRVWNPRYLLCKNKEKIFSFNAQLFLNSIENLMINIEKLNEFYVCWNFRTECRCI